LICYYWEEKCQRRMCLSQMVSLSRRDHDLNRIWNTKRQSRIQTSAKTREKALMSWRHVSRHMHLYIAQSWEPETETSCIKIS
jgi:hypothetical protein